MNILLPIYQHPVLVVLIDDNQSFLDSVTFQLDSRLICKTFTDIKVAIDWIKSACQHYEADAMHPIHVSYDDETSCLERRNAAIDLNEIYYAVLNKRRFDIPAVLVVDYAMPQMNGTELCEILQNYPCKKILLTGQADEKVAVDAFNNKLIDQYIKKNDPIAISRLELAINSLKNVFFAEQTSTLKDLLTRHTYTFLADTAIAALVEQLYRAHGFVEHYLFPNPSGILFIDVNGKAKLMVIETNTSLMAHYEMAQLENAPDELLVALKTHQLIPFFSDSDGAYESSMHETWMNYCKPLQICNGSKNYYWAIFNFPQHYLNGDIYSYKEFLMEKKVIPAIDHDATIYAQPYY
jgi:CheY-like chemotaxis protein